MARAPHTVDDLLFEPLSPSALARTEREIAPAGEPARALAEGRAAVEALARSLEKEAPAGALRDRLMASFGRGGRYGVFTDRIARLFDISVDAASKLIARLDDPSQYKPGPAEGIAWILVRPGPKYPGAFGAIGRLKPGARFPHHEHVGPETTIVLDGGFLDESGEEVWRGDEMIKDPGTAHDFVVLDGGDCIAAVLAQGFVMSQRG